MADGYRVIVAGLPGLPGLPSISGARFRRKALYYSPRSPWAWPMTIPTATRRETIKRKSPHFIVVTGLKKNGSVERARDHRLEAINMPFISFCTCGLAARILRSTVDVWIRV